MKKEPVKRVRIEMRVPETLVREVEKYQEKYGYGTRTEAFLALVRKGLEKQQ